MCNCNDNINSTTVLSGPAGPTGAQGIQGYNAYGLTDALSTAVSGTEWRIDIAPAGCQWPAVGQIVYIEGYGYFTVASLLVGDYITVTNPGYAGNVTPLNVPVGRKVTPGGIIGATGATGPAGPAGAAGPTGSAGPPSTVAQTRQDLNVPIAASTDILTHPILFATSGAAYVTGSAHIHVTLYFESDAAKDVTLVPYINGVAQASYTTVSTFPAIVTGGLTKLTVSLNMLLAVNDTQIFKIVTTLNSYAGTTNLVMGTLTYVIQP